jgi:hypothetical protein
MHIEEQLDSIRPTAGVDTPGEMGVNNEEDKLVQLRYRV